MKNAVNGLLSSLISAKGSLSELKDMTKKTLKNEREKK